MSLLPLFIPLRTRKQEQTQITALTDCAGMGQGSLWKCVARGKNDCETGMPRKTHVNNILNYDIIVTTRKIRNILNKSQFSTSFFKLKCIDKNPMENKNLKLITGIKSIGS